MSLSKILKQTNNYLISCGKSSNELETSLDGPEPSSLRFITPYLAKTTFLKKYMECPGIGILLGI